MREVVLFNLLLKIDKENSSDFANNQGCGSFAHTKQRWLYNERA